MERLILIFLFGASELNTPLKTTTEVYNTCYALSPAVLIWLFLSVNYSRFPFVFAFDL